MGIEKNLAIVSVVGRDQKGVVARVSTYLASCNINIEDIEQRVMEGLFIMTMRVDLSDLSLSLDEMILGLKKIGEETHMEVSVRLHSARERKRVAVLVSKEPHCLEQLIADRAAGLLNGDLVTVLSNHEVLRPIAEKAGLPFEWFPSTDKPAHEKFLLTKLREVRADYFVLARYMQVLTADVVRQYPSHVLASHVAAELSWVGATTTIPIACAAGNGALAYASDIIRCGAADVVLAGGADAFSRITFTGFSRLGAIAPDRCQPFDRARKGMIPGEGAAMLLLEEIDHARRRRARVYAELAGYGLSCDAHHMTSGHPFGDGAARAMEMALAASHIDPAEVSYISAHGTGTVVNDRLETLAIKRVFGPGAYQIPVSSIKSMLGHAMGAASAIEAAVCALAVATDCVPPTMHLEDPDPSCDLDYVPNRARPHRVAIAMNNAYAFGGNNSCVILRKYEAAA